MAPIEVLLLFLSVLLTDECSAELCVTGCLHLVNLASPANPSKGTGNINVRTMQTGLCNQGGEIVSEGAGPLNLHTSCSATESH